ncbi:MAG: RNB domain-containing ribonuclease [Pseudomonadota bacterium]
MTDPVGHLVEFIDKNRIALGLVLSNKKGRLGLWTAQDRQVALPQGRVLLMTPAAVSPEAPRAIQVEYMQKIEARREDLAGTVDVDGLWELVHAEAEPLGLKDLCDLCFGDGQDGDRLSATLRALFNEHTHFRLAGNDFVPLSADQLEQKAVQQERENAHRGEVDAAVAYLKALPAKGPLPPAPPGLAELLAELTIFEDDAPQAKKAKEVVALAELGGRRQVYNLLIRMGHFRPHENLDLLRADHPAEFGPTLEAEAAAISPFAASANQREDLTGLYTFTIDGPYTTDFDDALSFDPDPAGGGLLGVHITDAAATLPQGGGLDREAMARGSSLYLPDQRIPMLPPKLSEDALSLREGELRPAISCLARIDAAGQVVEYRLSRSLLRVTKRLTYDEADAMIEADPHLGGLYRTCDTLRQRRGENGAYFLPLPEVIIGVDEQGQVWVRRIDRDGPAREMVAETAILANTLSGQYLAEMGVPALFRTQAPPREPFQEGDPSDLFLHFRQRRLLNRVELTTEPGQHASLGVQHYTHATSPIRRYLDLVVQRQLGAALAGQPCPYALDELKRVAMEVEPAVRRGMKLRQARQRYWLLRWLEAKGSEPLEALVMEYQVRRWQLLIPEIMLITTIPTQPDLVLEPGQRVMIKVQKADAFYDILRVGLA